MKILSLIGSPRTDGNSAIASSTAMEIFKENGYETEECYINKIKVGPCIACNKCKIKKKCVIKDDFPGLLDKIQENDVLAIFSPIYFGRVPGPLKNFIDRCYSLFDNELKSSLKPGIKCLFTTISHAPPEAFGDEVNYLEKWFVDFMKFASAEKVVIGKCGKAGELKEREEDMKRIKKACIKIVKSEE